MTQEDELRELLGAVDDPSPVPVEFETKLWSELRRTLHSSDTARAGSRTKPPAISVESDQDSQGQIDAVELDFRPPQKEIWGRSRMLLAAAATVIVLGLAWAAVVASGNRNDVSTADVTPSPTATPTSSAIEPPLLADPSAACARYVETVGDSARQIESTLFPEATGLDGSVTERLILLEGAVSVLARDLAASRGLDFAAIEIQLGLVTGALDQLRLEVSADNKTAAMRTFETALSALGAVANMVPDGACDELRA